MSLSTASSNGASRSRLRNFSCCKRENRRSHMLSSSAVSPSATPCAGYKTPLSRTRLNGFGAFLGLVLNRDNLKLIPHSARPSAGIAAPISRSTPITTVPHLLRHRPLVAVARAADQLLIVVDADLETAANLGAGRPHDLDGVLRPAPRCRVRTGCRRAPACSAPDRLRTAGWRPAAASRRRRSASENCRACACSASARGAAASRRTRTRSTRSSIARSTISARHAQNVG